jgi:hypothetical protein
LIVSPRAQSVFSYSDQVGFGPAGKTDHTHL